MQFSLEGIYIAQGMLEGLCAVMQPHKATPTKTVVSRTDNFKMVQAGGLSLVIIDQKL